jgi:uncharacterized protein (DUF58 family)
MKFSSGWKAAGDLMMTTTTSTSSDFRTFLPQALLPKLERLALQARHRMRGSNPGKRRSGQTGSSLEFADYRPYAPGDELRKLDWRVYAKTGRPYVKLFQDEQELPVTLYVDASASMSFQAPAQGIPAAAGFSASTGAHSPASDKYLYAKRLAACVGYAALCGYDRVGVQLFSESITARLPMLRGKGSLFRLMEFLAQARTEAGGDLVSVFMKPASLPQRPGQTWIFSDFLFPSGVEESIKALLAARQEVRIVQVLSPEEWNPVLSGDLRLIDCETGTGKEVAVTGAVLEAYKKTVRQYTEALERFCRDKGIPYHLAVTGTPLEDTILNGFRRAGMLQS